MDHVSDTAKVHNASWTTCQTLLQHGATLLTECRVAGDKTRRVHAIEDIIYYS
jgi:hypothetical protein